MKNSSRHDDKAAKKYPGVDINIADNDKEDGKLVKERTSTLNCNPRSESINKDA